MQSAGRSVVGMMRTRQQIGVVGKDVPVRRVVQVMVEANVEGVLVVDGRGRVVGSIGDEQLVRRANAPDAQAWRLLLGRRYVAPSNGILDLNAGDVMLTRVVPVSPDLASVSALRLLDDHAVNVLPVLDEGQPIGAVFRCDLVRQMFHPIAGLSDEHT